MAIELKRKAFEAWHESEYGEHIIWSNGSPVSHIHNDRWQGWLAATANAKAVPEGFVLVPEECSDDMACKIAAIARVCGGIAGDIYEAVVNQAMIEAREQSHDGK